MKPSKLQVELRVALLYALFGGLWILLSDRLLAAFITDISLLTKLQTYKGWIYVVISALLIYILLRRELTLRAITEFKFRESQERYRLLFETSIDALLLIAPDGSIHAANPAACHMFGWTEEELKSIGCDEMVDQNDPRLSAALEERASKGSFRGELTLVRKDGTKFPGEISTAIFTDAQGNEKTSTVIREITTRVQTETALRESEEKYRLLFENVMNGFALHEIVLNDEGKPVDYIFLEVNDAFEQMTGLERENILGKKVTQVIPDIENDTADWIGRYGEVTLTGNDIRFEQKSAPFGKWYSVLAFRPREGQFATIFEDITERKHAENELHRRVDELSALYQTTLDIISVQELPDLLNTIVMRAVDLLGGTGGGLYLCDSQQRQVRCVVSYKTPTDYTGTVLAYREGAAGIVADTGEPLIIDDYQKWEGRADAFESVSPFSAVISVPMLWHNQVIGVIHVLHDTQKHKFTESDLTLLTSFANQAAVSVENARLFEETQQRLERLSALRSIDQVITSSLDLRVTLDILLGQILQLLEVDAASVLLYQPELQSLEFVAGQGFRTRTLQTTKLHLGRGFAGKAALEQRVVQILDLDRLNTGFLRSTEFRNEEFVAYIGVPLIAKGNIIGVLEIYNRQRFDPDDEWMDFLETLAGQAAIAIDNINLFNNLEMSNLELIQAYDATIEGWARALELRDMETEGHSRRVVDMTIELARQVGIEEENLVHVRQGALLHDIGKMGVPDSVLQKSDLLTPDEWETIYQHPEYAYKWLSPISYLKPALDIPYCHHEKWDGSGYPRGLKGEQIPLAARIFAVVDVWDALRSDRPYRGKWSKEKTRAYILEQSGKHFDPKVVEAFLTLIENE